MSFYKKFVELCDMKGVSATQAALSVGLSRSAPVKWKYHDSEPSLATLKNLAEYFGVSVGCLTDTEVENPDLDGYPDIRMIARAGKRLTPDQRENLIKYMRFMFPDAFEGLDE